jgi:hypothetical protein
VTLLAPPALLSWPLQPESAGARKTYHLAMEGSGYEEEITNIVVVVGRS